MIIGEPFKKIDKHGTKRSYILFQCNNCEVQYEKSLYSKSEVCQPCSQKLRTDSNNTRGNKVYSMWIAIKDRCNNPNNVGYKDYGGRGIKIQPIWENNFPLFEVNMLDIGYKEGLIVDRIDNDIGYEKGNIRFVDFSLSNANRRKMNRTKTKYGKSSKYFGVSKEKDKYRGTVRFNNIMYQTKRYKNEIDAAIERDKLIDKYDLPNNKSLV